MATTGVKAKLLTGVPPYNQTNVVKENGKQVIAGCGPVAALMLLAYYDARFGYQRLVPRGAQNDTGLPDDLVIDLRKRMHTVNDLKNGETWGMTLPGFFESGLDGYVTSLYGKTAVKQYGSNIFGRGLDDVFSKSRELIDDGKPHCFLFDWKGSAGIFPNHYVTVVGYRTDGGRKDLIVNAGWGASAQFQTVDLNDKTVKPATLYYIDSIRDKPESNGEGHQIGPAPGYKWDSSSGKRRLVPTVRKHFSTQSEVWEASDASRELFAGSEFTVSTWN